MNLIEVKSRSTVEFGDIAELFAEMNSREQAVFLQELFDALKFRCKEHFKHETQLLYIAKDIKEQNFKNLFYVFETLDAFLKDK